MIEKVEPDLFEKEMKRKKLRAEKRRSRLTAVNGNGVRTKFEKSRNRRGKKIKNKRFDYDE